MARVSKVDQCMFCGNTPCTCRSAAKAPPKPRTPRAKKPEAPIVGAEPQPELQEKKADIADAMRSAAKIKHQGSTVKEDHDATDEMAWIKEDPEMLAALSAVLPIAHPLEQKRFDFVTETPIDHKSRAGAWKARVRGGG